MFYTIISSSKFNDADTMVHEILNRIANHNIHKLDELFPNYIQKGLRNIHGNFLQILEMNSVGQVLLKLSFE